MQILCFFEALFNLHIEVNGFSQIIIASTCNMLCCGTYCNMDKERENIEGRSQERIFKNVSKVWNPVKNKFCTCYKTKLANSTMPKLKISPEIFNINISREGGVLSYHVVLVKALRRKT